MIFGQFIYYNVRYDIFVQKTENKARRLGNARLFF